MMFPVKGFVFIENNNKKACKSRGDTYLWCCECCCAAHGVLHVGCLNIQSFKLALKFVHDTGNLKRKKGLRLFYYYEEFGVVYQLL